MNLRAVSTCATCASVFPGRDEDGAPEIPGQRCADPECQAWICDAGCAEHFSFTCDQCGWIFCAEHKVEIFELKLCPVCAIQHWNTCGWCEQAAVVHRYADGTGACEACHQEREHDTKRYPDCPACGHRYWVSDMDERVFSNRYRTVIISPGRMFRCSCGLKFTREAAAVAAERKLQPQQPTPVPIERRLT